MIDTRAICLPQALWLSALSSNSKPWLLDTALRPLSLIKVYMIENVFYGFSRIEMFNSRIQLLK